MATKFLNDTGLAYFWSKIKSYIASLLSSKADDSAVVHIAGTETITGAKTFSSAVTVNQASIKATVKDTNSSTTRTEEVFKANSSNSSYGINTMFGSSSSVIIGAGEGKNSQLTELAGIGNENVYIIADANIYLRSNANTYANAKTFIFTAGGNIEVRDPIYERGVSETAITRELLDVRDKNGVRYSLLESGVTADKSSYIGMFAYKTTATSGNNIGVIRIGCDSSGNVYTQAPTPSSAADNTTKIATTAWVRTATGNFACNAATASAVAWSGVTGKPTTIADYGITDANIANGTITLGSNSITPLTSVPSHNQASNTINAMTGYSKPSSGGSIAASDTLNQAIGKLEKAIDDADISNVVHLTGEETISGLKKFLNNLLVAGGLTDYVVTLGIGTPLISMGEDPDSQIELRLVTYDNVTTTQGHRFGVFRTVVNTDGSVASSMEAYQNVADPSLQEHAGIYVGVLKNGEVYASAPSTSSTRTSGTDILTRNWIPNDTRIVHTTGAETVAGQKTFVSDIIVGNHDLRAPTNDTYVCLCGGAGESYTVGARLSLGGVSYAGSEIVGTGGFILRSVDGSDHFDLTGSNTGLLTWRGNNVHAGISTSGSGNAVTAISVSNNTLSVTKGTTFVATSGNQTVAGTKTFSARTVFSDGITLGTTEIRRDVINSSIVLTSGTGASYTNGAKLTMYGATYSDSGDTTYRGAFRLMTGTADHHYDLIGLKGGGLTWNGQTVQTSSDERIKTRLQTVDDAVLSAWDGVDWGEFKYLDAVAEKGEASARLHVGLIAQQVIRAFAAKGLDACRYGICCHDESADLETGAQNDLWMVRYAEALCMEAAYMRRENARLKERLALLEERVALLLEA